MEEYEELWVHHPWLPVKCSSYGRVWALATAGRKCKPHWGSLDPTTGYRRIQLLIDGKYKKLAVHRLVCESFHVNTENKPWVLHIDGLRTNNAPINLRYADASERHWVLRKLPDIHHI